MRHARRLSEGDLTSRADGEHAGRIQHSRRGDESDGRVAVARRRRRRADGGRRLELGARLASVSEQISLSAGQMANAMTEVSHGAEAQVQQLRRSTRPCRRFAKPPTA